jgi:DNA-binding HxlR family transcriptional regulator
MVEDDASGSGENGDGAQSDLLAFLEKRGAVELLATVDMDGVRYGYLDESFGISHDTVSKHLALAEELDLIEPESVRGERGVTHEYVLTPLGARIHRELKRMGAVDDFNVLQMYRRRVPEYEEEIKEWVREREDADDLHDRKRNHDTYEYLKRDIGSTTEDSEEEK